MTCIDTHHRLATVGTFDGVHAGHRHLVEQLKAKASALGLEPLVLVFDRHPREVLGTGAVPPSICSTASKASRLEALGVRTQVLQATEALLAMPAREFLQKLAHDNGVAAFMMGFNNHIGSDRCTASTLRDNGVMPVFEALPTDNPASSTAVRAAVAKGDLQCAHDLLGAPYTISGTVISGRKLGRRLGFPTANIAVATGTLMPPPGVYAATAHVEGHEYACVCNIGTRPTVDEENTCWTEVHILDFARDIYGKTLTLTPLIKLRDIHRFDSFEKLSSQIAADVNDARRCLAAL